MNIVYPEPERLAIARCLTTNLSTGETMGDDGNNYDYTLFDVVASTLAQDMPEEIEFASWCPHRTRDEYILRRQIIIGR